ncbi:MAG TPA: GspH/FimT family pseudopilin [Gemmatimonadales bacterium]
MRRAFTLIEVALALALIAIVVALTVPAVARQLDRLAVVGATAELAGALQVARDRAITGGHPVTVRLDRSPPAVTVVAGADTLLHRDLGASHAITLTASRDSMSYLPTGLAHGAANLGVVLSRGDQTRRLTVSRLGRVKW